MKTGRSWADWIHPRLGDLVFIGAFLVVLALGGRLLNVDGDLGRHLTLGEWILNNGSVPTRDVFSHTMGGQALTPHEWLSEVIFALANRWAGLAGVVALCALLIALTFTIVFQMAVRCSQAPFLSFAVVFLGMAASSLHWLARPHLFTLLACALWILGMERARGGKAGHLWLMAVGMAVWANLHGAFIAGFAIWGIYGAGMCWDRLFQHRPFPTVFLRFWILLGLLSFGASLVNPVGIHLWGTSLGYLQNRYLVGHTAEYLPPNFREVYTWPFLVMIGLSVLGFATRAGKRNTTHGLLTLAWTLMSLVSARNIPIYAVVATPVIAEALSGWKNMRRFPRLLQTLEERYLRMENRLKGFVWPALVIAVIFTSLSTPSGMNVFRQSARFSPEVFPVAAADWLQVHPQHGRVFNYFPWGGYLLYRFWPQTPVFIDGQTDFYGEALTREYESVITVEDGWQDILERYQVEWVILPVDGALSKALQANSEWGTLYEDSTAIILRSNP